MPTPAAGGLQPALPWAGKLDTDDLDEIIATLWRQRDHSRVPHRQGDLGYRARWALGEQVSVGLASLAVGQTIRAASGLALLHLGPPPGTVYRVGRREYPITETGTLTLVPQGWEVTRHCVAGATWSVGLDERVLAGELNARCGAPESGRVFGLHTTRLDSAGMVGLQSAIRRLVQALQPGAENRPCSHARAHLTSALCDRLLPGLALTRPSDVSQRRLADLEAWIDAHLETPLTLGSLCQQAGVGERSLQKAFELRRGMSPMRFVTERRLEAAHRRLARGAECGGVTRVAMDLGFDHLGRFSSAYRELFGQSPSQLLRPSSREAESGSERGRTGSP